jgi:hypothetical protein
MRSSQNFNFFMNLSEARYAEDTQASKAAAFRKMPRQQSTREKAHAVSPAIGMGRAMPMK